MASALGDQDTREREVVSLSNVTEVELQRRIEEYVVKDQVTATGDRKMRENDISNDNHSEIVANFQEKMVKILVEHKGIDKVYLNDVWGVVIDPSQVRLHHKGLYRRITKDIGEYEIKDTIPGKINNDRNKIFIVQDVNTGSEHIMKTTPLEDFSEHKELQCMLDPRIENLRPKLYAIYLEYPSVYLHMEFLQRGVTLEKFMKELMPRIKQEMEIPYVFHIWFIADCLTNVKTIKCCRIAHNDLTEGNIMIVLASDQSIKVMFIDFEMASTWDGDQPDDDFDISDVAYRLQKYLTKDLQTFAEELKEKSHLAAGRIFRILKEINEIVETNKIKTTNNEDDLMKDLTSLLDEIDGSGDQRKKLFCIIENHVNNVPLDTVLDLTNLEIRG